jgi:4-coumarate--CoA ligase
MVYVTMQTAAPGQAAPPESLAPPPGERTAGRGDRPLPAEAARRALVHLLAAMPDCFAGQKPAPADFEDDAHLDEAGLGCDSLARLQLAEAVAEFFDLRRLGREDLLLARPTVGAWVELAAEAWAQGLGTPVLRTSGSSGAPKRVPVSAAEIWQEADALAGVLADPAAPVARVLALVPAHRIYGLICTVALPARLGAPVRDLFAAGPDAIPAPPPAPAAEGADLLVAVPVQWRYLVGRLAPGAPRRGLSAGAPLGGETADALLHGGALSDLLEIYGATETGGLGWRRHPEPNFRLFDHMARRGAALERRLPDGSRRPVAPQDRLAWRGPRSFRPAGRLDGGVQVGARTVYPAAVARRLEAHPQVAAARVRPLTVGADTRLKALVVPAPGADPAALEAALWAWIRRDLPSWERPVRLALAAAVPTDALGKDRDWDGGEGDA